MAPNADSAERLVELARGEGRDRSALARLISITERGGAGAADVSRLCHPLGGSALTVGVTGAPGAGKSTLTNALCAVVRDLGDEVAVVAIDPSSPFSGGAILGDRVRMSGHDLDPGVFVRSMATRGHLGGLSTATPGVARVLDAAGFPWIIIETVGVGQVEVEIAGSADVVVVVVNPRWGDAVQANKAGLMEIADVFVINKADQPGAGDTRRDLVQMLALSGREGWIPPIVGTVATEGSGVDEVTDAVRECRHHLERTGELAVRRERRARVELRDLLAQELQRRARVELQGPRFDDEVAAVVARRRDPWAAVGHLLDGPGEVGRGVTPA